MTIFKTLNQRFFGLYSALLGGISLLTLTFVLSLYGMNSSKTEAAAKGTQYATIAEASAAVKRMTAGALQAGCNSFVEEQQITSPETTTGIEFGSAIAVSGNTAVVGAPWDLIGSNNRQGSAFVYIRTGTTWSLQQKLVAPDGAFDDQFGAAVAIDGNTILIGARNDDIGSNANQGSAYVFVRNGSVWSLQQKLTAADGGFLDGFGNAVSIAGNTALVGASEDGLSTASAEGSAYVFVRSGAAWSQQQKLIAQDRNTADRFGASVAISGESALIGSPLGNVGPNTDQGAAYVFVRNGTTWSQQQKLIASAGIPNGYFGASLDIDGETAVIGFAEEDSAYVFVRNSSVWSEEQILIAPDGQVGERFGSAVGISGDTIMVTANGNSQPRIGEPAAYVFRRSGNSWNLLQQLFTSIGRGSGTLSFNGTTAFIGLFIFECNPCPPFGFSPAVLPNGREGTPFSTTFTVTGGNGPYSFDLYSGDLPPGLSLSPNGVLSGSATTAGEYIFILRISDSTGCTGRRIYRILVYPACTPISITPSSLPSGTAGLEYSASFSATGGPGIFYSFALVSGTLPPGISLASSGILGTPTTPGTYNFTIQATDSVECTGSRNYTLTIGPPCSSIVVSPTSLASGTIGIVYSQTLTQTGGTAPITWGVPFGELPIGLTLSPSGVLTGTPIFASVGEFTIRATDASGCTGERAYNLAILSNGLQYYPLPRPIRLFDTRAPIPGFPACANFGSPLSAGGTIAHLARITCDGITIPETAQAIVGNATVINPSGNGYVTIWPNPQSRPPVSTLNYLAGQVVANAFTTALGTDGRIMINSVADTDLALDITGYFAPPGTGGLYFHRLPRPIRLLDSRAPIPGFPACANLSAPLTADAEISRQARITCDGVTIPSDAQAIVGNATVVTPAAGGFLTLWPNGQSRPSVSNLNFAAGQVVPNAFTVGLGSDGQFRVYTSAGTHLVLDVAGYYSASPTDSQGNNGSLFIPLSRPIRVFDTRAPIPGFPACAYLNAPIAANSELSRTVTINCDGVTIPSTTQAIVGNATIVSPAAGGYATIYPFGQSRPIASNLNFVAGQTVANAFTAGVISGGQITIFSSAGTHFIVDLTGYFSQ